MAWPQQFSGDPATHGGQLALKFEGERADAQRKRAERRPPRKLTRGPNHSRGLPLTMQQNRLTMSDLRIVDTRADLLGDTHRDITFVT